MSDKKIIIVVEKINDSSVSLNLEKMGGVIKVSIYPSTSVIEIDYDSHCITDRKILNRLYNLNIKVLRYIVVDNNDYRLSIFRERRKKIFFNILISIFFIFIIISSRYLDIGSISIIFFSLFLTFIIGKKIYKNAINFFKIFSFDVNVLWAITSLSLVYITLYSYFSLNLDINSVTFYLVVLFTTILLFNIYEYLNSFIIDKINTDFESMLNLLPSFVTLIKDDRYIRTDPFNIKKDDLLFILRGERIPVDGILISNKAKIKKLLNPFKQETEFKKGDFIYSGGVNVSNDIIIKAHNDFKNSLIYQIINISKRFYEKRKEITLDKKIALYYFYFLIFGSLIVLFLIYFKENSFYITYMPIFFLPAGYNFSFLFPYFFVTNYLSKNGIILNNPSSVFEISKNSVFIIDTDISVFSDINKKDLIDFVYKLKSYGFKVVCIFSEKFKDLKDELDVESFINIDVSEKHSIVLRYKVFGYKVITLSEGIGNLGMISLSDVGINMIGNYDTISRISDVVLLKKRPDLIFVFLSLIKRIIDFYHQNLYISVFSVLVIYMFFAKYKFSIIVAIILSVFLVFINSIRVYLKD